MRKICPTEDSTQPELNSTTLQVDFTTALMEKTVPSQGLGHRSAGRQARSDFCVG
jgi:hypothetical protein